MNQSYSIREYIYRNKKNTTYKWCNPSFEGCKSLEKAIKTVENVWNHAGTKSYPFKEMYMYMKFVVLELSTMPFGV